MKKKSDIEIGREERERIDGDKKYFKYIFIIL